jgi:hypothetical protein
MVALALPATGSRFRNLELPQRRVGKEELGERKAERKGKAVNFLFVHHQRYPTRSDILMIIENLHMLC